jgi:simple sugar transport system substrate-binding protein
VSGINAAIASKVNVIATSVPDASALKDPLSKAAGRGIEIITVNSGEGAFDSLKTFDVHVGQDEEIAGEGAGKQFTAAGAKSVVVVIHEASNSGLTDRAKGVKKTFKGTTKTLLIPDAKADIPGTQAKIKAYFAANKGTDALLGLDPDVTVPAQQVAPSGTKVGTFDVNPAVISGIKGGKILFAIDQQQYLQGYLPVVFAVLFVNNLNTVGGGKPVLTGPGIINKANAAKVAALAAKGTR